MFFLELDNNLDSKLLLLLIAVSPLCRGADEKLDFIGTEEVASLLLPPSFALSTSLALARARGRRLFAEAAEAAAEAKTLQMTFVGS